MLCCGLRNYGSSSNTLPSRPRLRADHSRRFTQRNKVMQVTLIRLNTSTQETVETQVDIEDRVVLGRHLDSPVLLQGEALSRQHFALFITDDQLLVENLSVNGTRLNGEALAIQNPSS